MRVVNENEYYQKIKNLNISHYSGEVPFYSSAPLRSVEKSLLSKLKPKSKILDVGSGSGRFSIGAASLGFVVTGIDITPKAIRAAQKRTKKMGLKNVNFTTGDMVKMPFKSNTFDYVICPRFSINAVATFAKRRKAVGEMLRTVKMGGVVYIESFNKFYLGKGPVFLIKNLLMDFMRVVKISVYSLLGKKYYGLLPGDITYESNKVKGAPKGYTHLPSIFELRKTIPNSYNCMFYSIPQVIGKPKFDPFKYLRYSIWIEIYK